MPCLDEDSVLRLASGHLTGAGLAQAEAHLAVCRDCVAIVASVVKSGAAAPLVGDVDGTTLRGNPVAGLRAGALIRGTYRVIRKIGQGGMGVVYEATHQRLAGRYAIKVLHAEIGTTAHARERFRREARVTSGLQHPNVVGIIDFDETENGTPYLVMEYLEGPTLATYLAARGRLAVPEVVDLAKQLASGLAAAHHRGIIHRDLKPQNVLVVPQVDGRVLAKIVDFGLSKVREASIDLSLGGAVMGTPRYMAPEQARGQAEEVDHRADQFALATTVYEMFAARPAFSGDSVSAALYQIVYEQPTPLAQLVPGLPPGTDEVIARGMAKAAGSRYPAVREFADALEAVAQGTVKTSRTRLHWAVAAAGAFGALAGGGYLLASRVEPERITPPRSAAIPEVRAVAPAPPIPPRQASEVDRADQARAAAPAPPIPPRGGAQVDRAPGGFGAKSSPAAQSLRRSHAAVIASRKTEDAASRPAGSPSAGGTPAVPPATPTSGPGAKAESRDEDGARHVRELLIRKLPHAAGASSPAQRSGADGSP